MKKFWIGILIICLPQLALPARLKDIATVKGVRDNILIGYGVVVGLKGTGDSSLDVTAQSLGRLFTKLGIDVEGGAGVKSKNAASVIVTAKLPAFSRVGNKIDITVSSICDAASLEGGVLLVTPLRAGDQEVYAVAQGMVSIGANVGGDGKAFPTVGRVIAGATIEKDLDQNFAIKKNFRLSLGNADFTTAARVVATINAELGGKFAAAVDSGTVDVVVPFNYEGNSVELLAMLENIQVNVDSQAKVILNERTGTVVMGQNVSLSPIAIAHGDLSITVEAPPTPGADIPPNGPSAARAPASTGGAKGQKQINRIAEIKQGSNVSDLVKALNALGVSPKDMTAIFQTLRKVGALQAELELM